MEYGFPTGYESSGLWEISKAMWREVSADKKRELSLVRRVLAAAACLLVAALVPACGSEPEKRPLTTSITQAAAEGPGGNVSITIPGTLAADFQVLEQSARGNWVWRSCPSVVVSSSVSVSGPPVLPGRR